MEDSKFAAVVTDAVPSAVTPAVTGRSFCPADEMLSPDSSRFWPADLYEPGHSQPSFDKQFARDWLKSNKDHNWPLPEDVTQKTIDKYLQVYKMLTGNEL